MKKLVHVLFVISISVLTVGCDNSKNSLVTPTVLGLSASATTVILLTNDSTEIVVSSGIEPYTITEQADGAIVAVTLSGRVLAINSNTIGTTAVKIKDSSIPAKTITITINVVAAYTTSTSGSLSFNSDRGNFSSNGIGMQTNTLPISGAGVIALSEFDGTLIYAYKVNSVTSIDIVTMFFQSKTNLATGTYEYPSSDKSVEITYSPNVNPADTLTLDRGYILAASANANIETLSSTVIKGVFSGNGYYADNGNYVQSQTIAISNGTFNVPILKIGKRQESVIEQLVLKMIKR
ncbi:MAG: hypothetical protein Q8L88_15295 [Bacteroidota bacterium]|nr:hypothetical protein [Bacteroidota bacterium]